MSSWRGQRKQNWFFAASDQAICSSHAMLAEIFKGREGEERKCLRRKELKGRKERKDREF